MNFPLRLVSVSLGAFALVGLAATFIVPKLTWLATGPADVRARRLAMLRLIPAGAALVTGLLVTASFLNFEPRKHEEIGWMIPAFALGGAALLVAAAWRWAQILVATRRLTRDWLDAAEPLLLPGISVPAYVVTSSFPVVAVVGLRRPKLVIARSVLDSCTPEELQAVLAHEQGHLDRHDNLRRLLMAAAPDAMTWLPASKRLVAAWRTAIEEAADDDASRAGDDGRLCLASALIKVAKLAPVAPGEATRRAMPASALFCGENLDGRVRRLLEPREPAAAPRAPRSPVRTTAAVVCVVAVSFLALRGVQALVEITIHRLP